jgi:hypothetical protein
LVAHQRIKELSIVKMNIWADFSATWTQWQKPVNWLGKNAPEPDPLDDLMAAPGLVNYGLPPVDLTGSLTGGEN